jgi:hemoglobin/transferrin/lactoferrin receptor protein
MRKIWMAGAALSLAAGTANAQQFAEATSSDAIVVTATRTAQSIDEVSATVSVITEEEIENNLANDIKDLVRFEPGVSVRSSPSRFGAALASTGRDGNSGFNIRGLEGNRVLFTVDGVRIPDGFSFGPAAFGRGDYVDLDLLHAVEIVRGPASALYGSDGLAGVVSFTTRDPREFLSRDESFGARGRVSYSSADDSWSENVIGAAQSGAWSALLSYTRRDGHEYDNQGENEALNASRTTPNPQDVESHAVLARVVYAPSEHNRFRLTYDYGDRNVVTEAYTGRAIPPLVGSSVINLDGLDESDRQRAAFDHRFENEGGLFDRGQWALYWQTSSSSQFSDEDRNVSADRTRLTTFDNEVWGGMLQLESAFETGSIAHRLVYGADHSSTRQEGIRNGTAPPFGEFFPVRAFPNTAYDLAGVFLQDQITLADGAIEIFPAVRYDHYELNPKADALYPIVTAGQSDSHVSPKIGVVAWPTERLGAFFNYASGFKAPAPSQVNNYFENPIFGYTSIPNPNLRPETSNSYEAGIRLRDISFAGATWRASIAGFSAAYEDFISQEAVSGSGAPGDPIVFQYVNLGEVDISGVEARADATLTNGVGLRFAFSTADGEQTTGTATTPLNTIDPWKFVARLGYDDPDGRFGGQFTLTHSAGKDASDIAQTCTASAGAPTPCFAPDDFSILDLTAHWNITESAALRVGVFNLTDETYWWWGDVRGNAASNTVLDAYTQPGRNVSASISYRF